MLSFSIKPSDKLIKNYYDELNRLSAQLHFDHEGAVSNPFGAILAGYSRKLEWTLVNQYPMKGRTGDIRIDGALLDTWKQRRGFWEAKDEHDSLAREIKRKIEKGYPTKNIIFQAPEKAVLYQNGVPQGLNEDITVPKNLVELLHHFFDYREPEHEEWDDAVAEFKECIPELAASAKAIIDGEHKTNREFREAFDAFYRLCQQAINPNLNRDAVEKMLVQHLLTERIFRRVFHAEEFRNRNIIAAEIEKVIASMTSHHFSRDQFLAQLDRFYKVLERAADSKQDYTEKQAFLNTVYERFFQGYSPKEADTHGIVYTPQPIVDFMVRSVEDILKKEFGRSLASRDVHILDPFVGTGNFIVRVMRQIAESDKGALPWKYEQELHCNEVMLLPYYIASMNIEHEYMEQTGQYRPFDGICLVDTFELAEPEQGGLEFMTEENTERVKRQKRAPIFVIIGNPPYNANQQNENDNNKNRKYPHLDARVRNTYTKSSTATNLNTLSDPFIKAFRWATDRLASEGIVAFVTNNAFIQATAGDGVRKHLAQDFDAIYVVDLTGDVRQNPKISGTMHNVFGIQVGVSITLLVRRSAARDGAKIFLARAGDFWTRHQKYAWIDSSRDLSGIEWTEVVPDDTNAWIVDEHTSEFRSHLCFYEESPHSIFATYSNGAQTNRDAWLYGFDQDTVAANAKTLIATYSEELGRWNSSGAKGNVDSFLKYDDRRIKWCSKLKQLLTDNTKIHYSSGYFRLSQYRPFTVEYLYFDADLIHRPGQLQQFFPSKEQNVAISTTCHSQVPFSTQALDRIPALDVGGRPSQCFPIYTYSEDGSHRRENITDWALEQFRSHYRDRSLSKWDIFHYVYAVLHHPEYRSRYAANLKRELPRIPFLGASREATPESSPARECRDQDDPMSRVPSGTTELTESHGAVGSAVPKGTRKPGGLTATRDSRPGLDSEGSPAPTTNKDIFWKLVKAGRRLAEIHVHYEQQPEYNKLEKIWNPQAKLDYRVAKMRLSKDKSTLFYNDALILKAIPPQVFDYRLGNRSALEWVIDQYQVSTDKRSGITNDPNRPDDPQYILRLIGQVITVSLETVQIVNSLPEFVISEEKSVVSA